MKFYYCPKCGGELDNSFKLEQGGDYVPKCKDCGFLFFQNSKPTGSIIPVSKNKILLAKRAVNPQKGKYDIIGGFLKENEEPVIGSKREFFEETGVKLDKLNYLGTYVGKYGKGDNILYTLNITYTCMLPKNVKITPKDDVESLDWFNVKKFDEIDIAFGYLKNLLNDLKHLLENEKFYS